MSTVALLNSATYRFLRQKARYKRAFLLIAQSNGFVEAPCQERWFAVKLHDHFVVIFTMNMNKSKTQHISGPLRAVLASGFLASFGVSALSFLLPLASLDARVSGAWLGTGFAGFFLARLVAGPLGGLWADTVGPRLPLLAATALGAFAPMLYSIFPNIISLYVVQFVLGVVSGLVRPVGLAVLGSNAPDAKQTWWFTAHVLIFNVALFTGPLLGGLLYWNRAIEPVLVLLAVCMVAANLVVFAGVPAKLESRRQECREEKSLDETRAFGALLVALFGRSFGIGVIVSFFPLLIASVNKDPFVVGMLFALPSLMVCLGLPLVQRFVRKWSNVETMCVGMGVSLYALFQVGTATTVREIVLLGCLMGIGTAFSMPSSMKLVATMRSHQGQGFGAAHMATGIGMVLGPLLGGFILTWTHSFGLVFELSAMFGGLCLVPFLWLKGGKNGAVIDTISKWVVAMAVVGGIVVGLARMDVQFRSEKMPQDSFYRYTEIAMGTVVNLTLDADSSKAADDAARKAMAYIRQLQNDFDYRNTEGSIGRINRAAGRHSVVPTRRVYDLLGRAVAFSKKTGGVFDPTIGALTTSPLYYILDGTLARKKKHLVNYRKVKFNEATKRVWLSEVGMALDLGGVAKGTIIDATVKLLRKHGIRAGIVEAGGDFYCFGDRDWNVGIRHPRDEKVVLTLTVREQAVCGSGDYQQFVNVNEGGKQKVRHHIINPFNMEPAEESLGVTVIAPSAEQADSLATTLFVMGPNKGKGFVQDAYPDAAAMWYAPDLSVAVTDNFPQ